MKIKDIKTTTAKQRKFIRELIRTFEPTEAAMRSFDCKNRNVAKVIACQLLTKLNLNMIDLMEAMGLDTERDIADLKKLREAKTTKVFAHEGVIVDSQDFDDNLTQLKALELSLKLKGTLKETGNVVVNKISLHNHPTKQIIFQDMTNDDDSGIKGNDYDIYAVEGAEGSAIEQKI